MSRRFHHWCYLNEEGKKLYGTIFPKGTLPVVSMIPSRATIEGKEEAVFLIYHEEMTKDQVDTLLKILAEKFGSSQKEIRKEMLKNRIPLRVKYTRGAGTDHRGLFVDNFSF